MTNRRICGNMKQYNPKKGKDGKSNRTEPDREPGQLETGRGGAANMVPEPECRNVAIPGLRPSQRKERQKHREIATPVCTGSQ